MPRGKIVSNTLTFIGAQDVLALVKAGMSHHDISAVMGVNMGRVTDVKNGTKHPGAKASDLSSPDVQARVYATYAYNVNRLRKHLSASFGR